jgi:hypothetical protein
MWFILCGLVFIPYAGIQNDETLFAGPLYSQLPREFRVRSFHHDVPLMLMSYLGALKTWVYSTIFAVWRPNAWSVRVPVVITGAVSVWLFFLLLKRAAGLRAAVIGSVLLATDTTFLLTTTFDWGPVALQHLLFIGGMVLAVAAYQDQNGSPRTTPGARIPWKLGWAFLLFGLGMWDKALFIWVLCGLVLAAVSIFRREVWQMVTRRNVATATAAFCLGALPLIVYNVRNPLKTFRGNASFSTAGFAGKAQLVQFTMNGSALFGYLVEEEWVDNPKAPRSTLERASVAIRNIAGQRRSGVLFWAFVAALTLAPIWGRRRRIVFFALMTMVVAWLQMALNKDTGGGVHHVVLLWPLPHMVIAVALSAAAARLGKWEHPVLIASVTLVCGANILVTNQYLSQFVRNGAAAVWSDAIFPLSSAIRPDPNQNLFVTDWGVFDTLRMLHQGKLRLWVGSEPLMNPEPTAADLAAIQRMLTVPSPLFICHTKRYELFNGAADRLENAARRLGYEKDIVRTISDTNGRPVFELVRFNRPVLSNSRTTDSRATAKPAESVLLCKPRPAACALVVTNRQALSTFARKWSADPPAALASRPPRS